MEQEELLKNWKSEGNHISYGPFNHKVFIKEIGNTEAASENTLLIIHGFPESSWSFHKVIHGLTNRFDRIIMCDMLGYGYSDKPTHGYTYSLFEQADVILSVWQHFKVKGGHVLSHDMGDSVGTENVARHVNGLLPIWFSDGIQSFTFTNGSMVLDLAKLRITQKLTLSRYGKLLNKIVTKKIFTQQVSSAHGNENLTLQDINGLWHLNTLEQGHRKTYLTIKYLNDRKRFEKTRWLPALSKFDRPVHLCWGEDDQVARIEMAYYLKENVCPQATLTSMKSTGHFCQLGNPEQWLESVLSYYK